ncbi:hypothetical protein [Amycolatopsis benzoatilytica]|uniref:hypothetical protein n=1 Tax=Amycolatopsis benzoatilytica TaxID=346045 RepID=UPI00037AF3D3|nr:hypothetical protein [Amycolatopsis benzoatilytica]
MPMTRDKRALASAMLAQAPDYRFYTSDLRQATRMHNARLYPLLEEWLERGWISHDYDPSPQDTSRDGWTARPQPMHYYMLTERGREALSAD